MSERMDTTGEVYLHASAKLEPLAFGWYAWSHMVAPVQHAMNIAFRHLPTLKSFVATPAVHVAACKDPAMLGGPFVHADVADVDEVRRLLDRTQKDAKRWIEFAVAFKDFDAKLQARATGAGLDAEYAKLPEPLKGLVEFVYDSNHHARIRIREELAAFGELDDSFGQSIAVSLTPDTDRKFFLTAPRIPMRGQLELPIQFKDARLDILAGMRTQPISRNALCDRLGLSPEQYELFRPFVTEQAPRRDEPNFTGAGVRVRYFGHACVLMQTAQSSVLLDPLTTWDRSEQGFSLTFHDLPDVIDCAIITHCHMDHLIPEMIVQLRSRVREWVVPRSIAGEITDPSMKLILMQLGCSNVRVVDPFDTIKLADGEVLSLPFPGEHCGLDIASKHSLLVKLRGKSFLFLVDSDAVDPALYARMRAWIGEPDALFIGMECVGSPLGWFYGPLIGRAISRKDDESRRGNASDCERAWNAIRDIKCPRVFVYAMGNELWNRYLLGLQYTPESRQITESDKFVERCRQSGREASRLTSAMEAFF